MINREQLEGQWKEVKGRLQERWGQLSDNELQQARGSAEQLVGVVQERTGAARAEIEKFLDQIVQDSSSYLEHASEAAQQYASEAREWMRETEHAISRRPLEAVATALGAGIIAGIVAGLVLKSK